MPTLNGFVYMLDAQGQPVALSGIPVVAYSKDPSVTPQCAAARTGVGNARAGEYILDFDDTAQTKPKDYNVELQFWRFVALRQDGVPNLEILGNRSLTVAITPGTPRTAPDVFYGRTFFRDLQASVQGTIAGGLQGGLAGVQGEIANVQGGLVGVQGEIAGARRQITGVQGQIDDVSGFGLITQQLDYPSAVRPGANGAGGGVALQQVVDHEIKVVLGRLPKPDDSRSFVAALSQRFTSTEVEGRMVYEWTPRSYIGQSDLGGGVTGAQASLVAFATGLRDESVKLIDGLYSLIPDADPQEVEAERTMLRSEWTAFVEELGIEGGPRVNRSDQLRLSIRRHLRRFGRELGTLTRQGRIRRDRVVTVEEEQNLTNFIAVRDYINSVMTSWTNYRNRFIVGGTTDLGRTLVLLSRELSVVAESVDESQAAMDSVFIGPAERLTIPIRFRLQGNHQDMTIDELMTWITTFTTTQATTLLQDGGRLSARTVRDTATRLRDLVTEFINLTGNPASGLPTGIRHPRVLRTLNELQGHLSEVVAQATNL